MNGRQPNEKSDLHDDEIIELKDVVQSGPEDDIIDLTEVLEQPEQAPSPGGQTAEATIAHEQPVSTEGADEAPMETDDDIIDLADLAAERVNNPNSPFPATLARQSC